MLSELSNPDEISIDQTSVGHTSDKEEELIERPFLPMWDLIEKLEKMRRKNQLPDDRYEMTRIVISQVGSEEFLKHARQVHSMQEIAKFYDTDLHSVANLHFLLDSIRQSPTHCECFYYGFYFAAWVKHEVRPEQRIFKKFGDSVSDRIESGGSLQSILRDIVSTIGYLKFRRLFELMGVNRVHLFLESLEVKSIQDLTDLDDLQCRHLIDQIIMKTDLDAMRLAEVQKSLGEVPSISDKRICFASQLPFVTED